MTLIGVFDSGIGGKSIADHIQRDMPDVDVLYVTDKAHMPYGVRSQTELVNLTDAAIQPLLMSACDAIVIACNTATAAAIETLRMRYPETPFVGLEPMIKPAVALTKTNVVAICATPFTLSSERYRRLKEAFASDVTVLEPDCHEWASMIEDGAVEHATIQQTIDNVCNAGADVIVLACTHYHWIKEIIEQASAGRATVIDPSVAISRQVAKAIHK